MITGFPSPAQGYEDKLFDLNVYVVKHPSATVFMQIETGLYAKMGIYNGDLLIIDRAKPVKSSSLVVYEENGQFVLGRVFNIKNEVVITGVITHVIHTVKEQ